MRTHFEAWCLAWKHIGVAHALGMYQLSVAFQGAQRDALIYGVGYLRLTADGFERVHPSEVVCDLPLPETPRPPRLPWERSESARWWQP